MQTLYTDYPFSELGDNVGEIAPIREVLPLEYDGDKYCRVLVSGIESSIKAGYIYTQHGRCGEVPAFNPTEFFVDIGYNEMTDKETNKVPSDVNGLLCCPYCGNKAEYLHGSNNQADAIYCTECPLGVEHSGMSFGALATIWNTLTKEKEELRTQLEQCQNALRLWKNYID